MWGRFEYFDVAIPLLFLVRSQAAYFIAGANIAHGPMPLLLVMLYCLAWTIPTSKWRYSGITIINFLLIYTGFGLFMGLVTLLLLALEIYRTENGIPERKWASAALILAIVSLASFFIDYHLNSASPCLSASPRSLLPYLWSMVLMFAYFAGLQGSGPFPTILGTLIAFTLLACFIVAIRRLILGESLNRRKHLVIAALSGYAILFCINTVVGRICLGITAGQQPRYVPYVIPALLAIYLSFASIRIPRARNLVLSGFLLFAAWCSFHLDTWTWLSARNRAHDQRAWRECYLQRESVEECDAITNTKIYPWPEATHLQEKLQFLKQKHLNLYSDQK